MTISLKHAAMAVVTLAVLAAGYAGYTHRYDHRNLHALTVWGPIEQDTVQKLLTLPAVQAELLARYPDMQTRVNAAQKAQSGRK